MKNSDQIKGRVKEAAGDLTDNDRLKREGKVDKVSGKVHEKVDQLKDRIHELSKDK